MPLVGLNAIRGLRYKEVNSRSKRVRVELRSRRIRVSSGVSVAGERGMLCRINARREVRDCAPVARS